MSLELSDTSSFLRPFWNRLAIPPWPLSLLLLALLAAARFYSAFGPPQARILFLLHILVMWTLPFLFLTRQGRRDIGLRRQGNTPIALVLCSMAGVVRSLFVFWIGMALYGNSPDNWCVSIRDSFQLKHILTVMSPAAAFAAIALLTMSFTPVGEEFLFRGLIQQSFTLRWNAVIATLVNGFAYGPSIFCMSMACGTTLRASISGWSPGRSWCFCWQASARPSLSAACGLAPCGARWWPMPPVTWP